MCLLFVALSDSYSFLQGRELKYLHNFLQLLPHVVCRSPTENLEISRGKRPEDFSEHDRLFDTTEYQSPTFQTSYHYLRELDANNTSNDGSSRNLDDGMKHCLAILLRFVLLYRLIEKLLTIEV